KINRCVDDMLVPQVVSQAISSLIPQSFFLGQTKIDVCLDGDVSSQDKGIRKSDYIQDKLNVGKFSSIRDAEKDFINKLVHLIFIKLEKHKLSYDELFQDEFSSLLYQALSTAKPSFWSANAITGFHYINSEEYPFDSLFKEEEYQDHIKFWSNSEMNFDDCELIEVDDECDIFHLEFDRQSLICDDFWDGFDEEKYIAQMEKEQEEEHLAFLEELEEEQREIEYYRLSSQESWTDVSDCWTRSEDEGWYYDEDD
ncbi:MAG: hypothetical protein RBT80_24740, partial [Candidatus Vecturithrix sp.]|nr:hypothetical protein [Candidatus Vecturithrix sp.]